MGINWIKLEDEMPVDNGHVQQFLVCTDRKTSSFQNCNITMCFFTDRFHPDQSGIYAHEKITHWTRIEKPDDLK